MSRWYTLHIKNEILFWFFILALVPLMLLSYINYLYQSQTYEERSKEHVELILNQRLSVIEKSIDNLKNDVVILSKTPNTQEAMKLYRDIFKKTSKVDNTNVKHERYFKSMVQEHFLYDIFLIDTHGNVVYTQKKEADLGTNLEKGPFSRTNLADAYRNSLYLLETVFSRYEYYSPSREEAAFIATPIYGDNELLGTIAIQIDTDIILEHFVDVDGLGESGEFYGGKVTNGNFIVSTTPLQNNKKGIKKSFRFPDDKSMAIYKALNGERGVGILKDYAGDEVVAAWGYIPSLEWGVVAKTDLDELLISAHELRFYSLIILFFVALGVIAAILVAIKHIVEPIEKLRVGVKEFANGKMQTSVDVDVDNEIGELSKNFNEMASSLKNSQDTIQKYANELEEKVRKRTFDLEMAKGDIEKKNETMSKYLDIIDKYVITSSTDNKGVITNVSKAFCEITGYSKDELIGKKHNIVRHPDVDAQLYEDMWKTISGGDEWSGEIKNQKKDGSFYWVHANISPIFDQSGNITGYTSIRQDITNKKYIEKLSVTDQLTKLYNRVKIEDVFKEEIKHSKRYGNSFSIILLDIDHFKSVNDTYGHDVGDETLKDVAKILKDSVRDTDVIGRWGGEEFMVISSNTTKDEMLIVAEKIRANIEKHEFKVIGKKTSSFGVSSYKEGDTQESMVKRADEALYEAKKCGRNCVKTVE